MRHQHYFWILRRRPEILWGYRIFPWLPDLRWALLEGVGNYEAFGISSVQVRAVGYIDTTSRLSINEETSNGHADTPRGAKR